MSNYFKHKMRGKSPGAIVGMVLFGIIAITGLAFLFAYVVMLLWNWLMPMIFGLTTLTFWQAVGVILLAKLLFGGIGGGGGGKHSKKKRKKYKCESDGQHKTDFSKWQHYDQFWEEKGDMLYQEYVADLERKNDIPRPEAMDDKTNEQES